jgi:DNA-directed RNA polymerase subunit RPC12/RpoP
MCRHSLSDLERMLVNAGFSRVESSVIDVRAVVVGRKGKEQMLHDDTSPVRTMSEEKHRSPWAHDDSEVKCPRCGSENVSRAVDSWAMSRGIQVYSCASCGRKFYDRGLDNYQPTYSED